MLSTISLGAISSSASNWRPGQRERLTPDDIDTLQLPALANAWRAGGINSDDAVRETYETAAATGDSEMARILSQRASTVDALMRSNGAGVVAVQTSHGDGSVTQIMTAAEFKEWKSGAGFSSGQPNKPEASNKAKASYDAARKLSIMQMVSDQLARMRDTPTEETTVEGGATKAEGTATKKTWDNPAVDETARKALTDVLGEGWAWAMVASGTTADGTRVTVGIIGGVDQSRLPQEMARGNSLQALA